MLYTTVKNHRNITTNLYCTLTRLFNSDFNRDGERERKEEEKCTKGKKTKITHMHVHVGGTHLHSRVLDSDTGRGRSQCATDSMVIFKTDLCLRCEEHTQTHAGAYEHNMPVLHFISS